MWRLRPLKPAMLALETSVERAGEALACAFSSSAEYEAALIAARRAAGRYGPSRHRRLLMVVAALAALLLALLIL
jgi:hypothetical protein